MPKTSDDFWSHKWVQNGEPVKIEKYFAPNVKNFINDAIIDTFTGVLNCQILNIRNDCFCVIQFVCAVTAIIAFLLDKVWKYPSYREALFYCVVIYFLFYGLFMLYGYFIIGNTILDCHEPEMSGLDLGHNWKVKTEFDPLKAEFTVNLYCRSLSTGKSNTGTLTQRVGRWIDEDGVVLCRVICKDIRVLHDQVLGKITN
ncbi:putative signal peptidase complex subunit 2 [Thelohanellus kitauei]|uniref:Signal peptidase complex subunit 2 n=1 Tax=Thelohanellus kitauei TaxID=669202 RepID=A0A0C2N1C5_THEKT|nr:putative signal peptidase complex subunit 2 [Thelohanellus kitauei]